ncbi:hypothetical protein ACS0TY_026944 [Phlomoides rotata]
MYYRREHFHRCTFTKCWIMEVLPCSGARHVGKSDCSKQESEAFKHGGISNCLQGGSTGDTYYGFEIDDGQNLSSYSHDSEDENVETEDHFAEPCRLPNNDLEVSSCTGITCLEQDIPQAVWVKLQMFSSRSDHPILNFQRVKMEFVAKDKHNEVVDELAIKMKTYT